MTEQKQEEQPVEHKFSRDKKNLAVAFIQFLRQEVATDKCTTDQVEAMEVAVQCLEGAFALSDKNYAFQSSKPLLELFKEAEGTQGDDKEEEEFPKPTQAKIDQANKLKEEGNKLVTEAKFQEAVQKYNEAIKLNRDPIYFCNRAAAYCRLEQNDLAIQDCRTALALNPNYAKAYGRMGIALSSQNRYDQAVEAYKHATELDPSNESYKTNLSIAEEKLREAPNDGGIPGFPGIGNLGGMLGNSQMAEMMNDPQFQGVMNQMMGAFSGFEGGNLPAAGLEDLMRVGAQFAENMSRSSPDLVEQLRQQFNNTRGPNAEDEEEQQDDDEQPPPS